MHIAYFIYVHSMSSVVVLPEYMTHNLSVLAFSPQFEYLVNHIQI